MIIASSFTIPTTFSATHFMVPTSGFLIFSIVKVLLWLGLCKAINNWPEPGSMMMDEFSNWKFSKLDCLKDSARLEKESSMIHETLREGNNWHYWETSLKEIFRFFALLWKWMTCDIAGQWNGLAFVDDDLFWLYGNGGQIWENI